MRKKILYINPASGVSGAEVSLLSLLEHLNYEEFEPILAVPNEGKLSTKAASLGIRVIQFPIYPFMIEKDIAGSIYNGLLSLFQLPKIYQLYRDIAPDIIHINSYRIGIPFSLIARLLQIPSLWHIRDIPAQRIKRYFVGKSTSLADTVIAISNAVASSLALTNKKNVHIIYNGIDFSHFSQIVPGKFRDEMWLDEDTILIVTIGQLIPLKGHDLLINAFSRIAHKYKLHLMIVGEQVTTIGHEKGVADPYPNQLKQLVIDLNLENQVTFIGFRADIAQILTDANFYVHAATAPEGFGRVLVEAMAVGKAVISPNFGGSVEIVEHKVNGFLFEPNNVTELAHYLEFYVTNPNLLHTLGENGQKSVNPKFSVTQHITQIQQIYNDLLKSA